MTLRYKTDDQLWFTFLSHELCHILLHRNKRSFVVDNAAETLNDQVVDPEMKQFEEEERTALQADTLIPPKNASARVPEQGAFTSEAIYAFSEQIGIGPRHRRRQAPA